MPQAKRAYLVFGPESAGNHALMECLVAAGCEGEACDAQRWDTVDPTAPLIAWGKSLPSGGAWPDVEGMVTRLRGLGYTVRAVVITRNWRATIASQVRRGHVADAQTALANLRTAYAVFAALNALGVEYVVCHYDYLVTKPALELGFVCDALGLPTPDAAHLHDGNAKYEEAVR